MAVRSVTRRHELGARSLAVAALVIATVAIAYLIISNLAR